MFIALYTGLVSFVVYSSYRHPSIAFSFVLCTYAIEQWFQSKDVFFIQYGSVINVVSGVIVLLALIFSQIKNGNIFKGYPRTGYFSIALFSYAFISIFWSPIEDISLSNYVAQLPYILFLTPFS